MGNIVLHCIQTYWGCRRDRIDVGLQLPVESVPIITKGYATNETDHHDITEKLLKVALNIINQPT